jgi:NTP pyrophosphatase (non-canonical NTP hydrolase)
MRTTTKLALDWACRSFGDEHVYNGPIRALRLAEEAVELAQAYGIPKDKVIDLIGIVYSRPAGIPSQELGGVMMTTTVLAASLGHDPEMYLENELRRVLAKPVHHFAQRNQEKLDLGLTA